MEDGRRDLATKLRGCDLGFGFGICDLGFAICFIPSYLSIIPRQNKLPRRHLERYKST